VFVSFTSFTLSYLSSKLKPFTRLIPVFLLFCYFFFFFALLFVWHSVSRHLFGFLPPLSSVTIWISWPLAISCILCWVITYEFCVIRCFGLFSFYPFFRFLYMFSSSFHVHLSSSKQPASSSPITPLPQKNHISCGPSYQLHP
jgi:hypothetical protein